MTYTDIRLIKTEASTVEIQPGELAQRLGTKRDFSFEALDQCRRRLLDVICYQCAYIRVVVDLSRENQCDFGFMKIPSRHLYRNLQGCCEAYVLAFTTGIGVDRLLARLNVTSQAEHFMTDALSSAAIESYCDMVCRELNRQTPCVPRFSPGYGDVSLNFQRPLLQRLQADVNLGIILNQAFLMTPVKSITAIMGIRSTLQRG